MVDIQQQSGSRRFWFQLGLIAFSPIFTVLAVPLLLHGSALTWLFAVPAVSGFLLFVFWCAFVRQSNPDPYEICDLKTHYHYQSGHLLYQIICASILLFGYGLYHVTCNGTKYHFLARTAINTSQMADTYLCVCIGSNILIEHHK